MTRDEVAAEVSARIARVLTMAGITAADETGGLKEPIDDALRVLGFDETALTTAAPSDSRGFIALVRYFTLKTALASLSGRFNISTGGDNLSLATTFENVKVLFEEAKKEVNAMFGSVDAGRPFDLDLDYLTDDRTTEWA